MSNYDTERIADAHPIFEACKNGDLDKVKYYLNQGISVYADSESNPTIASIATHQKDTKMLDLLSDFGLDFSRPFNRFGEPLLFISVRAGDLRMVEYFLSKGVNSNISDNFGGTPVMIASGGGNIEVLRFLADKGVDLLSRGKNGSTPFREASRNNHVSLMEMLYSYGADIDEADESKVTPLIGCAKGGKLEATRWLLDHGADMQAKDGRGKTALQWAESNRHEAVADLLRQRGAT